MLLGTLILSVFAVVTYSQSRLDKNVGIVNSTADNTVCLAIRNKGLKKGQKLTIIFPDKPQTTAKATVQRKLTSSCSSEIDVSIGLTFYRLAMPSQDLPWIGFGLASAPRATVYKGRARADVAADSRPEFFRSCTSMEGVHLTIWSGKPLKSTRLWHRYYYLGYDTEPSCNRKDFIGTDD